MLQYFKNRNLRVVQSISRTRRNGKCNTQNIGAKAGYLPRPNPALLSKCIVGCIFYSVGRIITSEIPCISAILLTLKITMSLFI
jgi:hypothetical protein